MNLNFTIIIMDFNIINLKILKQEFIDHFTVNKTANKFSLIANFTIKQTIGFKYKV